MTSHSPQTSSAVKLRAVAPGDEAFLLEVYASTRADEMALVPWDHEQRQAFLVMQFSAQQEHYQKKYPKGNHYIILAGDRQVGRLYVARLDDEIRIIDLTLLPHERRAGIGTHLLGDLLDEARGAGRVVRIYVESFNPSLRLFENLGFAQIEQSGIHLLMESSQADR